MTLPCLRLLCDRGKAYSGAWIDRDPSGENCGREERGDGDALPHQLVDEDDERNVEQGIAEFGDDLPIQSER